MEIPSGAWRACLFFLCFGTFLLAVVVFMSIVGFCAQSVGKKSIFSLGGVIQAIAGITLILFNITVMLFKYCNSYIFFDQYCHF